MKKIEFFLLISSLVSLVLNAFLVPFSSLLLISVFSSLALFYFYFSTALFNEIELKDIKNKDIYNSISPKRKIGTFSAGVSIAITITGILFYLQFWPGTALNLISGFLGLLIVLIFGTIKYLKTKDVYYFNIFKRVGIFFILSIVFMIIPRTTWLDIKYRNQTEYVDSILKSAELEEEKN